MGKTFESSDKTAHELPSYCPTKCAVRRYEEKNGFLWIIFGPFELRIQARVDIGFTGSVVREIQG